MTGKNLRSKGKGGRWPEVADPAIAKVLDEFLDEQRRRLAPRTFRKYDDVIGLLKDCLDGYGHLFLDSREERLFDRFFSAEGDEHREFCEIFGPEHILPSYGEFLGYFMIRKVDASEDTMRAAGTVTRKLARRLHEMADQQGPFDVDDEDVLEGQFTITRILDDRLWLEEFLGGAEIGPVALPRELVRDCRVGWTISGALARVRGKWRLLEAWTVYPD